MTRPKIIIHVKGGVVQDVRFPRELEPIEIEVRDYDGDGSDERDIKDKHGFYIPCIWKNPA